MNALVAATLPAGAQRRGLVIDDRDVASGRVGSVRALAMIGDVVVFTYTPDPRTTWILGFDLDTGEVRRVSRLLDSVAGVGTPSQAISIWTHVAP